MPLFAYFIDIDSFHVDSDAKNYVMNCIIYEVLMTICGCIGMYYIMLLLVIKIEVSASIRDTIWHWKKRLFRTLDDKNKKVTFEKFVKKHAELVLCVDSITGKFNHLIDTVLCFTFLVWLMNTYEFYKAYIKGYAF